MKSHKKNNFFFIGIHLPTTRWRELEELARLTERQKDRYLERHQERKLEKNMGTRLREKMSNHQPIKAIPTEH